MIRCFLNTSVGKKAVVALTGLVMYGFVIGHLAGNLQVFVSPEKINDYGAFLKSAGPLLWGTRIILLVSVLLHIIFTVKLTRQNRASRPQSYHTYEPVQASAASRFMIWSGVFLALFIPYHLLHFTVGVVHPKFDAHNIYANMVVGFSSWYVSLFYVLSMIALGFHLHHGVYSVFQTLGLNHPKYNPYRRILAGASAFLIPLGYISIPAGVWFGVIKL